jgi:DNA phosphorothioation-dependent restriction protein DptH
MTVLSQLLAEHLRSEFTDSVSNQNALTLRLYFTGVPKFYLDEIFEILTDEKTGLNVVVAGQEVEVVIFQIEPSSPTPSKIERACKGSEQAFISSVRNNSSIQFCLVLNEHGSQVQSLGSTVRPFGITQTSRTYTQWLEEPLIQHIWTSIAARSNALVSEERLLEAFRYSIDNAWESDELFQHQNKIGCWNVIERLIDAVGSAEPSLDRISMALGLFRANTNNFGSLGQLRVSAEILDYFLERGLKSGFEELKQTSAHKTSLTHFETFLSLSGVFDSVDFDNNSIDIISSVIKNTTPINQWWDSLDVDTWLELLECRIEPKESKLNYKILNELQLRSSGLPYVVRDALELEISLAEDVKASVIRVERSNGNAAFAHLESFRVSPEAPFLLTDKNIPRHNKHLRYRISSDGYQDEIFKIIVLDNYGPGVIIDSPSIKTNKPFSEKKKSRNDPAEMRAEIHFGSMGSHLIDIYLSSALDAPTTITGIDIDAEKSQIEVPVKVQGSGHLVAQIQTDDESLYEFNLPDAAHQLPYKLYLTAADIPPQGVPSEFDRLVLLNVLTTKKSSKTARVEVLANRRTTLERYLLQNKDSYQPIVLGPDFKNCPGDPWIGNSVLSNYPLHHDFRPADWKDEVPHSFIEARNQVLMLISKTSSDSSDSIAELQLHDDEHKNLSKACAILLSEYEGWLSTNYSSAIWSDLLVITEKQRNAEVLESHPSAIILSPLHPIRLAWQVNAQTILNDALVFKKTCPIASELTPQHFPDCLDLSYVSVGGQSAHVQFVALESTNSYWSVMWSLKNFKGLQKGSQALQVLYDLDFEVDGLNRGFNEMQVKKTINEVLQLKTGVNTLSLAVDGNENSNSAFNDGLLNWATTSLNSESDGNHWHEVGGRALKIFDRRPLHQFPEQSALAAASEASYGAINWYSDSNKSARFSHHLGIITQLGSIDEEMCETNVRSSTDLTTLIKRRVRRVLPNKKYLVDSLVGRKRAEGQNDELSFRIESAVNKLETKCLGSAEGISFAPNLTLLDSTLETSAYVAVSSSNIDVACFYNTNTQGLLWEYELPSFGKTAGGSDGYFLLARQSDTMIGAIRASLKQLGPANEFSDKVILSLLSEIPDRGMPTLKRLTAGGSTSLGELGMLVALKLLQFEVSTGLSGVLPLIGSARTINLLIPVDSFREQISALRASLQGKTGERPDLILAHIALDSAGTPVAMKLTPIEVKTRSSGMPAGQRGKYLTQARYFSTFLSAMKKESETSSLWAVAWRDLLSRMVDYGFRIYSQNGIAEEASNWSSTHQDTLHAIATASLETEIDQRGRLIVIDDSSRAKLTDDDSDGFEETIVLSKENALELLHAEAPSWLATLKEELGLWQTGIEETAVTPLIDSPNPPPLTIKEKSTEPSNTMDNIDANAAIDESLNEGVEFVVGQTIGEIAKEELSFCPGNTNLTQMNVGVVGDLGTGKTQLIKALIDQLNRSADSNRGKSPNILIFDYKRDYSGPEFVNAVNAKVVSPHDIPLNLFDISGATNTKRAQLERSQFFNDVLAKIYSNIGPVQRTNVKQAIKTAYASAQSFGRPAPTITDVFEAYKHQVGNKFDSVYNVLDDLVDGEHFTEDQQRILSFTDFLNGVVVIDLHEVGADDNTKNMLVAVFLNLFYEHMLKIEKKGFSGSDGKRRFIDTMLLVDEADNIMKYEFPVLKQILLQGREFGVGVLLASQYLSHFKTSNENYVEPLKSWFIHEVPNIKPKELEAIGLQNVDNELTNKIKRLECHECLYKSLNVDGRFIRGTPFFELSNEDKEG